MQRQQQIDEEKLRELCSRKNVWDHFGLDREDFLNLSEEKQLQKNFTLKMLSRTPLILLLEPRFKIQDKGGINIKKVFESGNDRTEMSLSTAPPAEEKKPKSVLMQRNNGFFAGECCDFSMEKDIEPYELKNDKIKMLRPKYDPINDEFLGITTVLR